MQNCMSVSYHLSLNVYNKLLDFNLKKISFADKHAKLRSLCVVHNHI